MDKVKFETQAVITELSGAEYGIPANSVIEIVRLVEITPVPESPTCVMGAIDYRGTVAVVIDLALRLGLEQSQYGLNTQIIMVENGAGLTGLVVDRVADVITIAPGAVIKSRESTLPEDIIEGAYEDGERLVLLLDMDKVLNFKKGRGKRK